MPFRDFFPKKEMILCYTFRMHRFFRVFHIEYILIGIALATFSCMAFFKARAIRQFALLDQKFLDLQEAEAKSSETINLRTGGGYK